MRSTIGAQVADVSEVGGTLRSGTAAGAASCETSGDGRETGGSTKSYPETPDERKSYPEPKGDELLDHSKHQLRTTLRAMDDSQLESLLMENHFDAEAEAAPKKTLRRTMSDDALFERAASTFEPNRSHLVKKIPRAEVEPVGLRDGLADAEDKEGKCVIS